MGYLKADANRTMTSALAIGSTIKNKINRRIEVSDEDGEVAETTEENPASTLTRMNSSYEQEHIPLKKQKVNRNESRDGNSYIINIHH